MHSIQSGTVSLCVYKLEVMLAIVGRRGNLPEVLVFRIMAMAEVVPASVIVDAIQYGREQCEVPAHVILALALRFRR